MKLSLFPREEHYFDLMDQCTQYLNEGAALLHDLIVNYEDVDAKIHRLQGIEHACDEIVHSILDRLNKVFITPIDREDIHALVIRLDDVLDLMTNAAQRLAIFQVQQTRPPAARLATIIKSQSEVLTRALRKLRTPKNYDVIVSDLIEIHRLENEADEAMKEAIVDLFTMEHNPIDLLRWKELYERLEAVTDAAEDVANVIQAITVKMS